MSDDLNQERIVIDNGSWNIRAGFSGCEYPMSELRAMHGLSRDNDQHLFGDQARWKGMFMNLKYPIVDGIIEDVDAMTLFWDHIFQKELRIDVRDETVLIMDSALNETENRGAIATEFFEYFSVARLSIQMQQLMATFSLASLTCLVADIGYESYSLVPIYNGHSIKEKILKVPIGGKDISRRLHDALNARGINLHSIEGLSILEDVKHNNCTLTQLAETSVYTMPDGSKLVLDRSCIMAPECLFRPQLVGKEEKRALHENCIDVITSIEDEKAISRKIFLTGSTCKTAGLNAYMNSALSEYNTDVIRFESYISPEAHRDAWVGGSIFASTVTFPESCVTRQEYEEYGPSIIDSKRL